MSGTSANGIDVAICRAIGSVETGTTGVKLLYSGVAEYPEDLRERIQRGSLSLDTRGVAELHGAIGEAFADAAQRALKTAQIAARELDVVGSHGQTVYHHSRRPGVARVTLQLGDGDRIAARLGAPVFFDFRARDVALGGEGAPLTPYTDRILYGGVTGRAVLNLGGIANLTFLADRRERITGFDVGPANAPLDRIARRLTEDRESYDKDGELARRGTVVKKLLDELCVGDEFVKLAPPKSTGFESYGDEFVESLARRYGGPVDVHVLRTVIEFEAWAIVDALTRFVPAGLPPVKELIIAGGGAENPVLIGALTERCYTMGIVVRRSEELDIPSAAREALAFAVLAHEALLGQQTSLPAVTGASHGAVLGKLCLPPILSGGV
jgi:anhydro-N-acetylmuramic acid kinase